ETKGQRIDRQTLPENIDSKAGSTLSFVRTVNPSGLQPEEIAHAEEWSGTTKPRAASSPAMRYGIWWHELMQQLPWEHGDQSWKQIFERNKMASPDPARSKREWELIERSDLRQRFAGTIIHKEMPIFWQIDGPTRTGGMRCLEGVVDLASF